jgi:hypothetical protein
MSVYGFSQEADIGFSFGKSMCTVDKIGELRGGDRMCARPVAEPIDAEIAVKGHSFSETHPSRVAP